MKQLPSIRTIVISLYCIYYMHSLSILSACRQALRRSFGGGRYGCSSSGSSSGICMINRNVRMSTEVNADTKRDFVTAVMAITSSSPSSELQTHYRTILNTTLCDACCIVTTTPQVDAYDFTSTLHGHNNFNDNGEKNEEDSFEYTHEYHDLLSEEVSFGKKKERNSHGEVNKKRLNTFLGGRIALRRAFKCLVNSNSGDGLPPLYSDSWGAPTLPMTVTASISHKDNLAVSVARMDSHGRIGVDLEHCNNKAANTLVRRVITSREKDNLGKLKDVSIEEEVLLRFSFKESVYKAIHPFIPRSIDFAEVEVEPLNNGKADITFLLKSGENFQYDASWQRYRDKYWLTCVYVNNPSLRKYR